MSYYRRYTPRPANVSSPEVEARVLRLREPLYKHLTSWEQGFVESIYDAYKKYKGLTPRQFETFEQIEAKYTEQALESKNRWTAGFDAEKRKILATVADYYREVGYFTNLVRRIDSDPEFIPDESTWKKFVENKYAQKVLKAQACESQFTPGGFALVRDTFNHGAGFWGNHKAVGRSRKERKGRPVLTLKRSDRKSTDKVWLCSYLDNPTEMWEIEERWIKKYRSPKN